MSDEDEEDSSSASSESSSDWEASEGGSGGSASNKNANKNLSLLEVALRKNGNKDKNLSLLEVVPERRNSRAMPASESSESTSSSSSSDDSSSSSESENGSEEAKRKDEWKYRRRKKSPPDKTTRMAKANNNQSNIKPSSKNSTTSGRNRFDSSDELATPESMSSSPEKAQTAPKRRKSIIRASRLDNSESNLGTRSWNKKPGDGTDSAVLNRETMDVPLKEEETEEDGDRAVEPEAEAGTSGTNRSSSERYHTPEQMRIMLDFYRQKHYPSKEDFLMLEQRTGLSPKKLLYWFSNRRRRKNDLAKETPNPRGRRPHSSPVKVELPPPPATPSAVLSDPDDQKFFMVQFFKTNPYPTREEMRQIGERIGLTEKKVFYWFSNRRRKEKPEGFVSRKQPKDEESISPERPLRPKMETASSGLDSDSNRTPSRAKKQRDSSVPSDANDHQESPSSSEREVDGGEIFKVEETVSETPEPVEADRPKKMADMKIEVAEGEAIGDASDAPRYSCRLCKYVTETGRGNLLRHFRDTHKMKPKFCKRCKLVYLKNAAFKSHKPCSNGTEAKAADKDESDDPEVSFSSPERVTVKREQLSQKPQFFSQRYKKLLDRLGSKSRKDQSVDEVAAGSPFQRNGKLELVMVTQGQFNAVQDFIGGDDTRVCKLEDMYHSSSTI